MDELHLDPDVNKALLELLAVLRILNERCGRGTTLMLIPHPQDEEIVMAESGEVISSKNPPSRVLGVAMSRRRGD